MGLQIPKPFKLYETYGRTGHEYYEILIGT